MSLFRDPDICDLCRRGHLTAAVEEIAFRQWSDKGFIECQALVMVTTCDNCGMKSLPSGSDEILDAAFRRAYERRRG
jgi:hypothetical protein